MDSFLRFLLSAKVSIEKVQQSKRIHIVLGNESCDLDSVASALVLAYFLKEHVYKDKLGHVVLPVLNLNSEELNLRTEVCYVLEEVGISRDHLIFRDDIDLKELQQKCSPALVVTLVDHHVLAPKDEFLKDNVISIFDHRPVDAAFKRTENIEQVEIQEVGSCSTLIAQEIIKHNENILSEKTATLLYDTIIYDTIALNPENGRVRPLDIKIAEKLERKFDLPEDRQKLFEYLWRVHTDTDNLTAEQLLLRDLKIVDGIPLPSLPMLVNVFLTRSDCVSALAEFAAKRKSNLIVLSGLEAQDVVKRDVAVFFKDKNDSLVQLIVDELKSGDDNSLQLEEVQTDIENIFYFHQKNVKLTRKNIVPLVKAAVQKNKQQQIN